MPHPDTAALARGLADLTWRDLFQRLDKAVFTRLWQQGEARPAFEALALDPRAEAHTRFLAAEMLFAGVPGFPPPEAIPSLATLYAEALKDAPRFPVNPWGMPNSPEEPVGQHVIKLGLPAAQALTPLLDDGRPVEYAGSKEATFGNSYRFRVKDLAAALIARIRHIPFVPAPDPAARDQAIGRLKETIKASGDRTRQNDAKGGRQQ